MGATRLIFLSVTLYETLPGERFLSAAISALLRIVGICGQLERQF
jgi:hypothetical protein